MRRATITVPDELDRALEHFIAAQPARPSLTSVVEAALEAYLGTPPPADASRLVAVVRNRAKLVEIARSRGATRVGVFGSVADASDAPCSDIDLWVETAAGVSLFDLAAMRADLETLLGSPVDLLTLRGLEPNAREELVARSLVL